MPRGHAVVRRDESVTGQIVGQHMRDAVRHEEFRARWAAIGETVEPFVTILARGLGGLLVASMLCGWAVAIVTGRTAA